MFKNLPKSWEIKTLSSTTVADVIMGQSPDSSTYNDTGNGLPFYQGKTDFGDFSPNVRMWCSKPLKIAEVDDILLSVRAPVGPINYCIEKSCIGRGLCAIRAKSGTLPKFLYYFFKYYEPILKTQGTGSTFDSISKSFVEKIKIPLPPTLKEQEEIVKILDTASDMVRLREECLDHTNNLIPAIFQEMFGDAYVNEKQWAKLTIKEVIEKIIVPSRDKPELNSGDIPWITLPDLKDNLFIESGKNFISLAAANKVKNKLIPRNSIILSCAGSLGKIAITNRELYINQQFYALIINKAKINDVFLAFCLKLLPEAFYKSLGSQTTIGFFSKDKALKIGIILPPLELQNKFADKVNEIEQYKKQQSDELEKTKQMFNSILHHAFTGELTKHKYGETL